MHTSTILIYKTPICFGPHLPIIRNYNCTKQLLGHAVICSIRNNGEIINVWFTEANMYIIVGTAYRLEFVRYNYCVRLTFCWPCIMHWFLVIVQLDAQILFKRTYLFIVLYMFRACHAHHQEKQIVSIQLLVIVTPCWWQCRVLVGSKLPTSTRHCHQHGVTIARSCIDTICFSWWWAWHARNM